MKDHNKIIYDISSTVVLDSLIPDMDSFWIVL